MLSRIARLSLAADRRRGITARHRAVATQRRLKHDAGMSTSSCPIPPPACGRRLLIACALADFALALLHVVCIFTGEATARFFTAPRPVLEMIRSGSWLIVPVCLAIVAVLGTFGLYAWSAAGRMRRLPWLRAGLIVIGAIYTLRGLALIPQTIVMLKHPGAFPWQVPVFSLTALALGLAHLAGAGCRWRALAAGPQADLH